MGPHTAVDLGLVGAVLRYPDAPLGFLPVLLGEPAVALALCKLEGVADLRLPGSAFAGRGREAQPLFLKAGVSDPLLEVAEDDRGEATREEHFPDGLGGIREQDDHESGGEASDGHRCRNPPVQCSHDAPRSSALRFSTPCLAVRSWRVLSQLEEHGSYRGPIEAPGVCDRFRSWFW